MIFVSILLTAEDMAFTMTGYLLLFYYAQGKNALGRHCLMLCWGTGRNGRLRVIFLGYPSYTVELSWALIKNGSVQRKSGVWVVGGTQPQPEPRCIQVPAPHP